MSETPDIDRLQAQVDQSFKQPSPYSDHGLRPWSDRPVGLNSGEAMKYYQAEPDALDLIVELERIYTDIGKVEHDALLAKARLVNKANDIINKLERK